MAEELQAIQFNFVGIIFITFLALILVFLVIYLLGKKQEWTPKKRGFFIGGLISLIISISIVLGMFSYYGSCTMFVQSSSCGQFMALVYPSNLIFALFFGVPAFLAGGLIGWIVGKVKSSK